MKSRSSSVRRARSRWDSDEPTTSTVGGVVASGWATRRAFLRRSIPTRSRSARRTSLAVSSDFVLCPGVESTMLPPTVSTWANAPPLSGRIVFGRAGWPSRARTSVARSAARVCSARLMPASRLELKRVCSSRARPPKSTIITAAKARVSRPRIGSRPIRSVAICIGGPAVSGAAHRFDRVAAELVTQVRDVDLDHVGAVLVGRVPDVLEELEPAEHLTGVAHEHLEQRELARCERELLAAAPGAVARRVQPQVTRGERDGPRRGAAAQQGAHARQQLVEGEG